MKREFLLREAAFVLVVAMLGTILWKPVSAHAARTVAEIISAAGQIIYSNEGSYASVAANDNGALSIGKLQWHGQRALALLQSIVKANPEQAEEILGKSLYTEINTNLSSAWESRTLKSGEVNKISSLLATAESIQEQDALAMVDLMSYVEHGQRQGIVNEAALIYYADLENQGGAQASARIGESAKNIAGSMSAVTLNELHEAAISDSVLGVSAYQSRRFATYSYVVGLGWEYCGKKDSLIPSDYVTAKGEGAAWIQRALNQCMKANLKVTGVYDEATQTAVSAYQKAKKLTVDGLAGRSTIVHLIKSIVKGENVTQSSNGSSSGNKDSTTTDDAASGNDTATGGKDGNDSAGNKDSSPSQEKPLSATALKSAQASYQYNDIHSPFRLQVTSSRTDAPLQYTSANPGVVTVDSSGMVTIAGAGTTTVSVSQAGNAQYDEGKLNISVTIYSTDPSSYSFPKGSLYEGRVMAQSEVQWLQATIRKLNGVNLKVNGKWSAKLTKQVKAFQKDCGIEADGIVGEQTKQIMKQMLAVKACVPQASLQNVTGGNQITWTADANANRVFIFRKAGNESYQKIKTVSKMTKTSYNDTSMESGKAYKYVVKFGYVLNNKRIVSAKSNVVSNLAGKIS